MIRSAFNVLFENNRIEGSSVSSFGYMSLHYDVVIKPEYSGPRYSSLHGIPFEIQVRTIAMDAWASVSHYLDYKTENDVPKELRKDFYALSGLFYVADRHFEMFFRSGEQSREQLSRTIGDAVQEGRHLGEEINLDSLTEYLRQKLPDRDMSVPTDRSNLVTELLKAGYDKIDKLDIAFRKSWNDFVDSERRQPPNDRPGAKFANTGVVRILLDLYDPEWRQRSGIRASRPRRSS